jgi:hypothetical protein
MGRSRNGVSAVEARRQALSLPEATEAPHHELTSFRVLGKIFATLPPDHSRLHVFVDQETQERAIELEPQAVEKLWWGGKVVGVKVNLAAARRTLVGELLRAAWRKKAPKRLAAAYDPPP